MGISDGNGSFKIAPALDAVAMEKIFQHKVLGMLLRKGKITEEVVKLILSWRHIRDAESLMGSPLFVNLLPHVFFLVFQCDGPSVGGVVIKREVIFESFIRLVMDRE